MIFFLLFRKVILNTVLFGQELVICIHSVSENQNIGLVSLSVHDEVPSEDHPAGALAHLRRQLDVLQEWGQRRGQGGLRPLLSGPGAGA